MPIYEYVCQDCGQKYEKFVRSRTAKIELVCPVCGSHHAEKAFSVFGSIGSSSKSGSSFDLSQSRSAPACGPVS